METERKHRSVSQLQQYEKCPQQYKLARIDKAWQRPAAWLVQGSAVHEAIEFWENNNRQKAPEEVAQVYARSFVEHTDRMCGTTPNFDYWFSSGRYRGEEDLVRRFNIGKEQLGKYFAWCDKFPDEEIWVGDDGTVGIEIGFNIELGGVPVRGFIDAVLKAKDGKVHVRDHKTGNRPGDVLQLAVYRLALEDAYGLDCPTGDFWMGKTGKATLPFDLTKISREEITEKFQALEANIQAENFEPDPEPDKCRFCDVSYSCSYAVG